MIADKLRALADYCAKSDPLATITSELLALADRVAELEASPCPHVVTSGETSHCTLAERDARDAARFRWLRGDGAILRPHNRLGDGARRTFGVGMDAAIDAAMQEQSNADR